MHLPKPSFSSYCQPGRATAVHSITILVGLLQFIPLRCSELNDNKAPESAKLSCSCRTATPKVVSCSASTGIVTLASDFPSNQLQAGDLDIQNTVNIPPDISSSTHPPPVYRLFNVTTLLTTTSAPGVTDSNCIRQSRFQCGCTELWNKFPADVLAANSLPVFRRRLKTHLFSFHCGFHDM